VPGRSPPRGRTTSCLISSIEASSRYSSHLAAAIANHRVARGHPALFVVVPDLLDHLRATFNPQSTVTFDQRFEEVRRAPLIVLDDLGTESATPWAREKLYQIFDYRYNARLPTVRGLPVTAYTDGLVTEALGEVWKRLKDKLLI